MRVHLDTDFAGDTDDACALAMLLGWPGVDVVGITTTADADGRRAGYVHRFLDLAGHAGIPVASGAGASLTTGGPMGRLPDHDTYWGGEPVRPRPSHGSEAIELLAADVDAGATVVAVGPWTNLAVLERTRPGTLGSARVTVMGGWVIPPAGGLPAWGPEMDWNVQCDTAAAVSVVGATGDLAVATLPATLGAHLRATHMERLEAAGPVGALLARQARAHAREHGMADLGRRHAALPDDLLNFQYDPAACALALGWEGVAVEALSLVPVLDGDVLRFEAGAGGRRADVLVGVDGTAFEARWLAAVEHLCGGGTD